IPIPSDPLWNMMQALYLVLNATKPNLTNECWLCYSIRPPYFEAVGIKNKVKWSNGSNPHECNWGENKNQTQGITMQSVTGKGRCIG
ncbi:ENV2 protein, partial [Crotophaga sulcirostris]|nr:ENV2 protein [Crotophaga sulcirostris]